MDTTVFDTNLLANIVKKMLNYFKERNSNISPKVTYSHTDVTLSKNDTECYTIRVTNYGQSTNDVLLSSHKIFWKFVSESTVFENSIIATIYNWNEHTDCHEVLDLNFVQNRLSLIKNTSDKNHIDFSNQKKYLSFLLKAKLMSSEVDKFTRLVIHEIISLQQMKPDIKFTIHIDKRILYNNYVALDYDYKSSQVLATALTNIIRQSLDVTFKEKCFSMLNVENSHEVESALTVKLLPLIHDKYAFPSVS
ncbi:uncharacterized protein LOC113464975 [Ceratina calcarata]|uniref:Uncharacterized protein LOC113464975 n=1 Tax=Ceratina calcarata TaxID=156304 RepID=A0AAJ7S988_9HYME|nr:uncharacterized protein LOC113464975 [Ceratina calcarata]